MDQTVIFHIQRFNPEADSNPHMENYPVDFRKGTTVLDGLQQIQDRRDPSLTFRRACRSGICGSCAVVINGKASLACHTQIEGVQKDGLVKIGPLKHFSVVKDLVVDINTFFEGIRKIQPWLIPDQGMAVPEKEYIVRPDDFYQKLDKADVCILCAACESDCLVYQEDRTFIGPGSIVKAARFVFDIRDFHRDQRIQQLLDLGLLSCEHSEKCEAECPKGIHFKELRDDLTGQR